LDQAAVRPDRPLTALRQQLEFRVLLGVDSQQVLGARQEAQIVNCAFLQKAPHHDELFESTGTLRHAKAIHHAMVERS